MPEAPLPPQRSTPLRTLAEVAGILLAAFVFMAACIALAYLASVEVY